ncbi:MAG: hypothetical protein EXS08_06715 [Planctomycetes bacterium]|nr:hypothetical protein [Planctomycetota bacterium]
MILSPTGEVRLDEQHARQVDPHPDARQPIPTGAGAFFLAASPSRVVMRVQRVPGSRAAEEWWTYELATGKALAREDPRMLLHADEFMPFVLYASAVPGTPLVLVQWWRADFDRDPSQLGAVFQLVDADWEVVWTMNRPTDYSSRDKATQPGLVDDVRAHSAVLAMTERRFELRFPEEGVCAAFGIERVEGEQPGWIVTELSRMPCGPASGR